MFNFKFKKKLRNRRFGISTVAVVASLVFACGSVAAAQTKTVIKVGESDKPMRDQAQLWFASQVRLDGKDAVFYHKGAAYSFIEGKTPAKLFNIEGYNIRRLIETTEKDNYFIASREIIFYRDAKTGEILNEWQNPLTNEKTRVVHHAGDPINLRYKIKDGKYIAVSLDGKREFGEQTAPEEWNDQFVWHSDNLPLYTPFAAEDAMKNRVGSEIFDFYVPQNELYKTGAPKALISWTRASAWLPWMQMRERAGMIVIRARSVRLESWLFLPDKLKNLIRAKYPQYQTAPDKVEPPRP